MPRATGSSGGRKSKLPPKYRDADTGQYVTEKYAKKHSKTTVKESK